LHAFNYGLRGSIDPATFRKVADTVIVPEFTPKSDVKIQINDNDPAPQNPASNGEHALLIFCAILIFFCQTEALRI